jgi:hypothetical protein
MLMRTSLRLLAHAVMKLEAEDVENEAETTRFWDGFRFSLVPI